MINSTNKKRIELLIQRNTKHGQAGTPTYVVWKSMIGRCERPTDSSYKYYGAKGVTVCERWHDFQKFFKDMGEASSGSHLHRLNGSKIYSKETCQWLSENEHIGLHNTDRGWGARLTRAQLIDRVAALNQELTAERQAYENKLKSAEDDAQEWHERFEDSQEQLLSAQAALEAWREFPHAISYHCDQCRTVGEKAVELTDAALAQCKE